MTIRQKLMKAVYPVIVYLSKLSGSRSKVLSNEKKSVPNTSIYDLAIKLINGEEISLDQLKGKKILFVNTATDCGFTGQYDELQKLQETFKEKLTVIGFPANDFKEQEKGSNEEIAAFCRKNYGVRFPLAAKTSVVKKGEQHPVYKWLTRANNNGWNNKQPSWNFAKYLVDEKGVLTNYFDPAVSPLDVVIIDAIIK